MIEFFKMILFFLTCKPCPMCAENEKRNRPALPFCDVCGGDGVVSGSYKEAV